MDHKPSVINVITLVTFLHYYVTLRKHGEALSFLFAAALDIQEASYIYRSGNIEILVVFLKCHLF
jgi:hypothetical protein